jgi:hypothetical protein
MTMIHENSPIRRRRDWTILNVQSVLERLILMTLKSKLLERKFRDTLKNKL